MKSMICTHCGRRMRRLEVYSFSGDDGSTATIKVRVCPARHWAALTTGWGEAFAKADRWLRDTDPGVTVTPVRGAA